MREPLDFSRRSSRAELMDAHNVSAQELSFCLQDLERANRITFGYRPTLTFLDDVLKRKAHPRLRILDVACGGGDALRAVAQWGVRRGVRLDLTGLDINPMCIAVAKKHPGEIEWVTSDVFDYRPPKHFDIVMSSLFTHHLNDDDVVRFLSYMEQWATVGWFVNDLHRHPAPYYAFHLLSRALRLHEFVRHDGPVSIARGFVPSDWLAFLDRAMLPRKAARLRWFAPFRLCVERLHAAP